MFTLKDLFAFLSGSAFVMRFGDGDGGGGDGDGNENKPDEKTQKLIDEAVKAATQGLKSKNEELLGSLRTAKDSLKRFDGIDPDAVNAMLKRFADDEEAGLIKEGKIDEVLTKRTERMQTDFNKKLNDATELVNKANAAKGKLAERAVKAEILSAATKAGAMPEAFEDIFLRAKGIFTVNGDGDVVAMDGDDIIMGKDGKTPLSPLEWAESLRETAQHLWPKGQGSGAPGSQGSQGTKKGNIGGSKSDRQTAIASKFPDLPEK